MYVQFPGVRSCHNMLQHASARIRRSRAHVEEISFIAHSCEWPIEIMIVKGTSISWWNSYDKNILYTTMARQRLRCVPGVVDNASGSEEHTLPAVITRCLLPDRSPCELVKIL